MEDVGGREATDFLLGEWAAFASSNVQRARYDPEAQTLWVGFGKPGSGGPSVYGYEGVPQSMAEALLAAPSKGVFVSRTFVKTGWPSVRG